MLDVVFIGLTVVFFVAVAALAKGVERLGRQDAPLSADPATDPAVDLAAGATEARR
ncbi:MAG TPA: hypothetical protein VIP77_14075 [Jiangellaceae bacterium]